MKPHKSGGNVLVLFEADGFPGFLMLQKFAQQRIVEAVRRLEGEGQIVITGRGGGKDDIIV